MSHLLYQEVKKVPGNEILSAAINVLAATACFEGPCYKLHNRVAFHENALWVDMTDEKWRAIRITAQKWELCSDAPILFTRYTHHASQIVPAQEGDVHRLFEFVSVADEDTRLLLLVWLVAAMIPGFPHPVPIIHGPHGSGKSSLFRYLRRLIDPSVLDTVSFPRDNTELVQTLSHHWAALFDNVDTLSQWQSDALCRAVTGEGVSKRQLYTNDEDVIYHFQRCIGINGINIVATRPDLLDRAILVSLSRIDPQQRRSERELEAAFDKARPHILGGILDTLVRALSIRPTVEVDQLPRMADFAHWGCAIAQALYSTQDAFLRAYAANLTAQNNEVLESHPVAAAIVALMEEQSKWEGQPSELLNELERVAEAQKIDVKDRQWPKAANSLTRRIRGVRSNLQEAGICIRESKSGPRHIMLHRDNIVQTVQTVPSVKKQQLTGGRYLDGLDGIVQTVQVSSLGNPLKNKGEDGLDGLDGIIRAQGGREMVDRGRELDQGGRETLPGPASNPDSAFLVQPSRVCDDELAQPMYPCRGCGVDQWTFGNAGWVCRKCGADRRGETVND
ncbi:MAG: hypothetical protein GKR89_22365 [Candidatus Latescibacteria bacterium]|nr:hypothetical protein [Candidatus Latescibacterota bacterium]